MPASLWQVEVPLLFFLFFRCTFLSFWGLGFRGFAFQGLGFRLIRVWGLGFTNFDIWGGGGWVHCVVLVCCMVLGGSLRRLTDRLRSTYRL